MLAAEEARCLLRLLSKRFFNYEKTLLQSPHCGSSSVSARTENFLFRFQDSYSLRWIQLLKCFSWCSASYRYTKCTLDYLGRNSDVSAQLHQCCQRHDARSLQKSETIWRKSCALLQRLLLFTWSLEHCNCRRTCTDSAPKRSGCRWESALFSHLSFISRWKIRPMCWIRAIQAPFSNHAQMSVSSVEPSWLEWRPNTWLMIRWLAYYTGNSDDQECGAQRNQHHRRSV